MGESSKAEISVYSSALESFSVETPGGRSISAGITKPGPRRMRNWPFSRSFLLRLGYMNRG